MAAPQTPPGGCGPAPRGACRRVRGSWNQPSAVASAVRSVRRHLLAERGIPRAAVSISGYWKRTRTEEGWREDKPEWNRLVEADLAA